jgi:hypothetical protein
LDDSTSHNFMNKILQIENLTLNFEFDEKRKMYRTKTFIDNHETEIYIDFESHRQKEVDWSHFEDFFKFINQKGYLQEMVKSSAKLVDEMGRTYFGSHRNLVTAWEMIFDDAIYYNGKVDEVNNFDKYSYTLLFNFFDTTGTNTDGDDYGLYVVEIEGHQIVGTRRI